MTHEKDDRPTAGGISINNGMNDTTVIPLTSASYHMTGIIEDLSNLKEIVQWHAELPDGNIAMAKKEGDLLDEGNCIVQFAPNICVIQDLTSRTVIGAGERRDGGLFYFRETPPTRAFKTTTTLPFDIWHKRLGNPSLEVLKLLPQSPLHKIGGNELVNKETTVQDNQTVRDDDTLSSPQSLNVDERIQEEN
ncbi:hypothetical protein Tco_0674146 [Tanacetum coccineum]